MISELTLGQAIPFLSPYVQNGQCSDASIVPIKINEACLRLHGMGGFLGCIQRWGVSVDQDTGEFSLPEGLSNFTRISVLEEGLAHSTSGVLLSDDEYAFVYDNVGLLPYRQVSPGRFKVIGSTPLAVDLMGKNRVKTAVADSDVLAINDVSALKLAVLALYFEEVNQLDMAGKQWESAVNYLKTKTDTAVSEARRPKFSQVLAGATQNTVGYTRAMLAMAVNDGLAIDDHKTLHLVNLAEEYLLGQTGIWEEAMFKTTQGIFALPPIYEKIYRATINNCPTVLRGPWYEFIQQGHGWREETRRMQKSGTIVSRGPSALHTDLPQAGQITAACLGSGRRVVVVIQGLGEGGSYLEETLYLNSGSQATTENTFYSVTSIKKDPSPSDISFFSTGVEVAYMWSWQQDSTLDRYFIPSCSDCREQILRTVVKPRYYKKTSDTQVLQVKHPFAVSLMAQAILAQQSGNLEVYGALRTEAINTIETSMANATVGESNLMDFQRGWMLGGRPNSIGM